MVRLRIFLVALCALPLGAAANAGTWVTMSMNDTSATQDIAARRGTRNYRPEGDSATTTPTTTPSAKEVNPSATSTADKLAQCMETWDTGTHISKSKWREICQRQLRAGD